MGRWSRAHIWMNGWKKENSRCRKWPSHWAAVEGSYESCADMNVLKCRTKAMLYPVEEEWARISPEHHDRKHSLYITVNKDDTTGYWITGCTHLSPWVYEWCFPWLHNNRLNTAWLLLINWLLDYIIIDYILKICRVLFLATCGYSIGYRRWWGYMFFFLWLCVCVLHITCIIPRYSYPPLYHGSHFTSPPIRRFIFRKHLIFLCISPVL